MRGIVVLLLILILPLVITASTYTVTNTGDTGTGSLRQAIIDANGTYGNVITFDIPTTDSNYDSATGVWTISPLSLLPTLMGGTIIDATTQSVNQGNTNPFGPEIVINGGNTLQYGLLIVSPGNTVKGIVFGGFTYGILIYGSAATQNTITQCWCGIAASGQAPFPNSFGIAINNNAAGNFITSCHLSGNTTAGIGVSQAGSTTITGCYIGINATGTLAIANAAGIILNTAAGNTIGGTTPSARNIISGNTSSGITLTGTGTNNNTIIGNYIGTDSAGTKPVSNHFGVIIRSAANSNQIGGAAPNQRNVISANLEIGVYIETSDSNIVSGNFIGPDCTGAAAFTSGDTLIQANGVEINTVSKYNTIGGATPGERNIISGNRVYGAIYYGNCSQNDIVGNYIGTDVSGSFSLPNATGICVDDASHYNTIENNLLSGNISYGAFIVTTGSYYNTFRNNLVGTNAAGTDTIPNDVGLLLAGGAKYNTIGGSNAGDRNVISGNYYTGIEITDNTTKYNEITGNYIGVDISGNTALPNAIGMVASGISTATVIDGNVISGNETVGLVLTDNTDSNVIVNNKIGVGADGIAHVGNGGCGIALSSGAINNVIGGVSQGNMIAYNDSSGIVLIDNTTINNKISANSIFSNGDLGIDIFPFGVNPNDSFGLNTNGPNKLMNYPVITSTIMDAGSGHTYIRGFLDTHNPQNATVEVFKAEPPSLFNFGEGKTYYGRTSPDSSGHWSIVVNGLTVGDPVASTATDANGNTSEFSENVTTIVGIKEVDSKTLSPTIFPNPNSGKFSLSGGLNLYSVEVYNVLGIQIYQADLRSNANTPVAIDMSDHVDGVYFIQLRANETVYAAMKIDLVK